MGNVHEPHLVGSELAIRIARRLAEQYGEDEQIKALLQEYTFYIELMDIRVQVSPETEYLSADKLGIANALLKNVTDSGTAPARG